MISLLKYPSIHSLFAIPHILSVSLQSGDEVEEWDIQLDMTGDFQSDSSSDINVADFQVNGECQTPDRCDMLLSLILYSDSCCIHE